MSQKALLVIDLQNDYFAEGKFPLWNTEQTLANIKQAINKANASNIPVIHIQHIADPAMGIAPFFNQGSHGAEIHHEIMALAPNSDIVVKSFADGFEKTTLEETLQKHQVDELLICGMMTQNCVTHTAISKGAEKYKVSILMDCTTTVNEMIHNIALHAVSTRVSLITNEQAL
ncbi:MULTISPECIES: cysteine hydrolase family protein [Vibrio]|uniref:Isochorismatase family protein n=1 Tax=Vibrio halioticoli NBRC 102217 TaxID=1219072 RepID=V5FKS6_9VIBR|nr:MULTISPECIES: cysteine hydrolase family protein [Vibrio]MPW36572.1 isochorismatase family protein [Vibrio sp. B1Z05]GAD89507.1 isochorismatase family protein [Vibrio halioticoli NBRC 102217]